MYRCIPVARVLMHTDQSGQCKHVSTIHVPTLRFSPPPSFPPTLSLQVANPRLQLQRAIIHYYRECEALLLSPWDLIRRMLLLLLLLCRSSAEISISVTDCCGRSTSLSPLPWPLCCPGGFLILSLDDFCLVYSQYSCVFLYDFLNKYKCSP